MEYKELTDKEYYEINEIVAQIVAQHRLWLTDNTKGKPADFSMYRLKALYLDHDGLESLDGVKFPEDLEALYLGHNGLTSVENVKFPEGLKKLSLGSNRLTSLNGVKFPESLNYLNLDYNNIKSLDGANIPIDCVVMHDTIFTEIKKGKKMTSKLQMTADDICEVYEDSKGLNLPLIKEATRQVELKVIDEHVRKERIDKRAYFLLIILMVLISLVFVSIASGYLKYPWLLGLTGLMLLTSSVYLFQALKPKPYAESGTFPHAWLAKNYIKSYQSEERNNHILAFALAHRLRGQEANITAGDDSNNKRLKLLDKALLILQCSMLPISIAMLSELLN